MTLLNLNQRTLQVLGNFASINPSMQFNPGSKLKTVSANQDIFGIATVPEEFPQPFAIYDLSKFLGVLSTYDEPKLRFKNDKFLTIHNEQNNELYNYSFADPSMILVPPADDELALPDAIAEFDLPAKALSSLIKRVSISKHPEVAIVADGKHLSIQAVDDKKVTPDNYSHVLGDTTAIFKVIFTVAKINVLMNQDYKVTVTNGIVRFKGNDVNYYIAPEESSTYG